jgi:hypothetical protein
MTYCPSCLHSDGYSCTDKRNVMKVHLHFEKSTWLRVFLELVATVNPNTIKVIRLRFPTLYTIRGIKRVSSPSACRRMKFAQYSNLRWTSWCRKRLGGGGYARKNFRVTTRRAREFYWKLRGTGRHLASPVTAVVLQGLTFLWRFVRERQNRPRSCTVGI